MNFFVEDRDVLRFPSDEEDIYLFLNTSSIPKPKQPRSVLERQLLDLKKKAPYNERTISVLSSILYSPGARQPYYEFVIDVDGPINVFDMKTTVYVEKDELAQAFATVEKQPKQKKTKQVSNHTLPRPRGCSTVLAGYVVLRTGKTEYYTDDEFKSYVEAFGGKTCSYTATRFDILVMCRNYNTNLLERATRQFSKRQTEEQFLSYIVNMTVAKLDQERQIQRSALTREQISEYVRSLPWVSFEESLNLITLTEVEAHFKMQEEMSLENYVQEENSDAKNSFYDIKKSGALSPKPASSSVFGNITNKSTFLAAEKNVATVNDANAQVSVVSSFRSEIRSYPVTSSTQYVVKVEETAFAVFYRPTTISQLFHSRVPAQTIKNEFLHVNKPIIVSGPTGQGKFLLVDCAVREIGYDVIVYNSEIPINLCVAYFSAPLISAPRPRVLVIKEVDMLGSRDLAWLTKYASNVQKMRFPLVLTTSDLYSAKIRQLRKACTEIALYKIGQDQISNFVQQTLYKHGSMTPQVVQRVLERVKESAMTDVRALTQQLNFMLSTVDTRISAVAQVYQMPSINQILINALTYGKRRKATLDELLQYYLTDPMQVASGLMANYLAITQGQLKPSIFVAEHLSEADRILHQMYYEGNWAAMRHAASFGLVVPALVSPIFQADIEKWGFLQTHYPVLGLERQLRQYLSRAMRIGYSGCRETCAFETEFGLRIMDMLFAQGERDEQLVVASSEDFCDLSQTFAIDECKGKQRKELLQWLDYQHGLGLLKDKKLVK